MGEEQWMEEAQWLEENCNMEQEEVIYRGSTGDLQHEYEYSTISAEVDNAQRFEEIGEEQGEVELEQFEGDSTISETITEKADNKFAIANYKQEIIDMVISHKVTII